MNTNRIFIFPLVFAMAIILLAVSIVAARDAPQQENNVPQTVNMTTEQLTEQTKPTNQQPDSNLNVTGVISAPLFIGVDNAAVPAYQVDVQSNDFYTAFVGTEVWGAAYDPVRNKVYFNDNDMLYEWTVGGDTPKLMGTISDTEGSALSLVGLAFYNNTLYGVRNAANEAVYQIDLNTLVATVHIDYEDADFDFGGFAADPNSGIFYGTNDDTMPFGPGLFRINPNGTAALVAPYPDGQTDIDGLAVSEDGLAYLIPDQPGSVYVYDLNAMAYTTPLSNPWTTSEIFSGGAWIYELPEADIEVETTMLSSSQPADTVMYTTLTIRNTGTADLNWNIYKGHTPVLVSAAETLRLRPSRIHPRPIITSPADCAAYENSAEREPTGYATFCMKENSSMPTASDSPARATDKALALDIGNISDNFVSHQLNDFTGQTILGTNDQPIYAMDFNASATTLYAIDNTSRQFGTLDLESGAFAAIATVSGIPADDNISGLTIDPLTNEAFVSALGDSSMTLYSFNLATGGATVIGSDTAVPLLIDIAVGPSGIIYGHDIGTDSIYTIDRNTGAATRVGPTGVNSSFAQGMDFDNEDGVLYAWTYQGGGANAYGTIDLVSGELTPLTTSNPQGEFEGAVQNASCDTGDIPWLHVNVNAGTTLPAGSSLVEVTFDATGLSDGVYTGTLCITSNDLDESLIRLPVTLTVGDYSLYLPIIRKP